MTDPVLEPFTTEKLREAREKLAAEEAVNKKKYIDDAVLALYNNISYDLIKNSSEPVMSGILYNEKYTSDDVNQEIKGRIERLFPECVVALTHNNRAITVEWKNM